MRHEGGFTLVEVLVAAILSSLAMLALVQAYQVGSDAWRRGQEEADILQSGRYVLSRIGDEVENAYMSRTNTQLCFSGEPSSLKLVTAGPEGLLVVWYRFDLNRGAVFRDVTTDLDPNRWIAPDRVWLEGVRNISFRYFDPLRKTWYERWDSRYLGRLPELVEVVLSLKTNERTGSGRAFPPFVVRPCVGRRVVGPRLGVD